MCKLFLTCLIFVIYFIYFLLTTAITALTEKVSINDGEDESGTFGISKKKPHIVIIVADDMGWNDVSFHGSDQIPTPNIDALAYNGIILNSHYVSAICTPSRTSLMTGKYPIHLGMQHNVILSAEPRGLPLNEKLLPQYLKEAGYKTHMIGKWHLGFYKREYTPTYRGFDSHFGYWNGYKDYYDHHVIDTSTHFLFDGIDIRRNLSVAWDIVGKYSTDLFTEEAVRLINAHNKDNPMFLYMAHLAVHSGNERNLLQAPADEIAKFSYIEDPQRRIYAAMVSKLDQSVGEIVETLRNCEMLENSIILFISDNGAPTEGMFHTHGSNYPLRGIKNSSWEGGVRGVAAIWSPLIKKRERVSNQLIYITDWLPTLLSAAGIREAKLPQIDGKDLWSTLVFGRASDRHEILINIDDIYNYSAIRRDQFKYVKGQTKMPSTWIGDSGRSIIEKRPPYDPDRVLQSKAGIAIASVQSTGSRSKRNDWTKTVQFPIENSKETTLTSQKILKLRREAEVCCNVTEEEKIPCNPLISPCLFNIEKDPCEMINIIDQQPLVAAQLEAALLLYRLKMVPPSNIIYDLRANPRFWNDTWTCWQDSDPSRRR